MKKKSVGIAVAILLIFVSLIGVMIWRNTPEKKVARFVNGHSAELLGYINSEQPIPEDLGVDGYDSWDGEHPMEEFHLFTRRGTYYGCYYSPDDVPFAFQNSELPLAAEGEGCWKWKGEGDNHGMTKKLADKWYYFEASF